MKTIIDDILTKLQNTTFSVEIPSDNILDSYPVDLPSFDEPYIIVNEIDNSVYIETFTHKEEHSILAYEIEIYCRQMSIDSVVTPSKKVARILAQEIDAALSSEFGLMRVFSPEFAPYDVDQSVSRYVLTYEVVLDLTTDYLYRR